MADQGEALSFLLKECTICTTNKAGNKINVKPKKKSRK